MDKKEASMNILLRSLLTGASILIAFQPISAYLLDFGIIPAAAYTPGAHGTFWQTDLYLFNGTAQAVDVILNFYASGGAYFDCKEYHIDSMKSIDLQNVVKNTFDYDGMGMIEMDGSNIPNPENPEHVSLGISSRTFTTTSDGGTYGQAIDNQFVKSPITSHLTNLGMEAPSRLSANG